MSDSPTKERVLKVFGRDAAHFIDVAASLGWRVLFNSTNTSITLIPYDDGPKRIHLSSRNKNSGALRKHIKTLTRFADPRCVQVMDSILDMNIPDDAKAILFQWQSEINDLPIEEMPPEEPRVRQTRKKEPTKKPAKKAVTPRRKQTAPYIKDTTPAETEKPQEAEVPASIPTPKQVAERVAEKRQLISERPAMMHYSLTQQGGRSYPSKTTIERRWSDGTVDYACAVETCGEVSENRRAFGGAHWAMHVRKGEAQPHDSDEAKRSVVDDPDYTEHAWTRKQNLRSKRGRELTNLLQGIDLKKITPEDLAEQILDFLGESRGGGGVRAEPLTDAQVLDRIRTLVDRGTYADQEQAIFERDRQIEDLMQYAEKRESELAEKLLEAEQRATKAEATMNAFYDLVHELKPGEA